MKQTTQDSLHSDKDGNKVDELDTMIHFLMGVHGFTKQNDKVATQKCIDEARERFKALIPIIQEEEREKNVDVLEALEMMYDQYCNDGHLFMSAGEHASSILERLGRADFDIAGRVIEWNDKK